MPSHHYYRKVHQNGRKNSQGSIFCGPPVTGKTLFAKYVAGEASVTFYSISGSDFVEFIFGVRPSIVRGLFKEAFDNVPCIFFIDEIDAVSRKCGGDSMGGKDERENTLNHILGT